MKQKIEKNYYELFDVTPESAIEDIEKGYRQAMTLYGGEGDAIYSLYSKEERELMVETVKSAYETLRDPEKKMAYDSMMARVEEYEEETPEVDIKELRSGRGDTLFNIPKVENIRNSVRLKKPFFIDSADPMIVEQYRILYSKLEEINHKNSSKVFAITSSVKGEGKSATCLNLAYIMATEYKKKTILVECDLRKESTVLKNLENPPGFGLADVLKGEKELHSAISGVEGTSLYILTAGNVGDKTSELVGSSYIKNVISTLKFEFDYVIVDSPPVIPLVDMSIISKIVDGVLLVVRAGKTQKDLVTKALKSLSGAKTVGIVLNGAETSLKKYYY